MSDQLTTNFVQVILKNQPMPDDLQKLWNMQISRAPDADFSVDLLAAVTRQSDWRLTIAIIYA
jgi:hypothetical protein